MATGKTSTLPLRIAPALKQVLRMTADREHRSIANMGEVLIREHCAWNGIRVPEQAPLFLGDHTSPYNR